jgi:hypothetical protein
VVIDVYTCNTSFQWQALVLVPVIGVVAGFTGLRLYERLLRRRESEKAAG